MAQQQLLACLTQKKELLDRIKANTETQMRLITRQDIRGLRRVIGERQKLIEEFAALASHMKQYREWEYHDEAQPLLLSIAERHRLVIEISRTTMELLKTERDNLKDRLRQVRLGKTVYHSYTTVRPPARGSYINTKG